MWIANKRGRVPPIKGIMPNIGMGVNVWARGQSIAIEPLDPRQQNDLELSVRVGRSGRLFVPLSDPDDVDRKLMSRFLLKVAMEALVLRTISVEGWRQELLGMEALDPVRRYVRIGEQPATWGYSRRRLYAHDALFRENTDVYEVLHEFDFVYTEDKRLFFFLAIFGEEYGIDMSDPDPTRCFDFLEEQKGCSPLYPSQG